MPENAKKPQIRFKGFTDAWEQRKLINEVVSIDTGKSKFVINGNGNYEILGSTSVIGYDNDYDYDGDFLLTARVGANAGDLYRYSGKVKISDNTVFIQGKQLDFIYYALLNFDIKRLSFGTGQPLVKASELKVQKIYMPYKQERELIGKFLIYIDNLITLHQRKLDKLKNIKKSMLEKMFPKNGCNVPEIRFKGFTDAWEQRKLGNLGKTYTGLSGKTKDDFGHGKAQFITYMNVYSNTIIDVEMTEPIEIDLKQNEVEIGDVFFTTSSETPEEVGMSSVLLKKCGTVYLNSFCFGFRPFIILDNYFLAYMLRAQVTRKQIILLAQGISRYNISKNKVMEINIFVPHDKEQQQLGKFFYKLDNLITLHQRKLEKLQNIKKACLEKMFV